MTPFSGKLLLLTACLSALSACSDLPSVGPSAGQIMRGAEAKDAGFAIYPVTRETLPKLNSWPRASGPAVSGWISRKKGSTGQVIEPGDTIDLTIWDNGDSSLLAQTGQKMVSLPALKVSPAGAVFLPYVDQITVSGLSPEKARAEIQQQFSDIVPDAQVQLHHVAGRESSVDLISGVAKPGNYVMPSRDYTVLSLIAEGGGIPAGLTNPQVRLMRGGELYGISASRLMKSPSLDTTLRGGDKVYVEPDGRYFLSLGAAGKQAQVPFPSDEVTALDAAALIGGVNGARGNPKGVLVLRDYAAKALRSDGTGPEQERMIFAIDLTTADGLFSAGEFQIADRDVVVVTESSLAKTETVLGLFGQMLGVGNRAAATVN